MFYNEYFAQLKCLLDIALFLHFFICFHHRFIAVFLFILRFETFVFYKAKSEHIFFFLSILGISRYDQPRADQSP